MRKIASPILGTVVRLLDRRAVSVLEEWRGLYVPSAANALVPFDFANKHAITIWSLVPALCGFMLKLGLLKPGSLPSIRMSLLGGEARCHSIWRTRGASLPPGPARHQSLWRSDGGDDRLHVLRVSARPENLRPARFRSATFSRACAMAGRGRWPAGARGRTRRALVGR